MTTISTNTFKKALTSLNQAIEAHQNHQEETIKKILRDACILRFTFCVDLAWKTSMGALGLQTSTPKPAIREMVRAGLISNIELWFDFVDARNKSSDAYDDDIATQVFEVAQKFIPEGTHLLDSLERK